MDDTLLTTLRTTSTYRMSTTMTEAIVEAAKWQHRQSEAIEEAIKEIERLRAENAALRKAVAEPPAV